MFILNGVRDWSGGMVGETNSIDMDLFVLNLK